MNQIIITVTNDKKERDDSCEATAKFDYRWNNSWFGYGGEMTMTAFGKSEGEAKLRVLDELSRYKKEFEYALSKLDIYKV